MAPRLTSLVIGGAVLLVGCPGSIEDPVPFLTYEDTSCPPDFDVERDLLAHTCGGQLTCHQGGAAAAAGLDLASPGVADRLLTHVSAECDGRPLLNTYDLESSLMLEKLGGDPSCGDPMPSGGLPPLTASERACLDAYLRALVSDVDASAPPPIDAGIERTPVVLEAEAMELVGYIEDAATPGVIRLPDGTPSGTASATFDGAAGAYQLFVHVRTESDGQPALRVRVDGTEVASDTYALSSTTTGDPAMLGPHRVELAPGDTIVLEGTANLDAWARIDRVELVP